MAYGEYRGKRNIKQFMRYVKAKIKEHNQTLAYRFYIAETLYHQAEGNRIIQRLPDIYYPKPKDDRDGDDIAIDIISALGLKIEE